MDAVPQNVLTLLKSASHEKDFNFEEIKTKIFIGNTNIIQIDSQISILGIYLITLFILQLAFPGFLYLEMWIGVKLDEQTNSI